MKLINPDSLQISENIYSENKNNIVNIESIPYYGVEQYDLLSDKDFDRFKQDTERMVRNSYEYRHLINFLKYTEGMNRCTFLDNIVADGFNKINIELHHTPFTLYDITSAVISKRMDLQEPVAIYDIANEIAWLHYMGMVGLIPVCETVHELIHNMYLFVPTYIIRGNYNAFVKYYGKWIDPYTLETLDAAERLSNEYLNNPSSDHPIAKQMQIFNHHRTYISVGDTREAIPDFQQCRDVVHARINQIKNGKKLMYKLVTPIKRKTA